MLIAVLLIFATALSAPLLDRWVGRRAGALLALMPLLVFVGFVLQVGTVASGGVQLEQWQWIPALDIALAFRLDGLSLLFALLVSGIGALIVFYAGGYLSDHHHIGRFHAYLLAFMGAMLGLVLADDLIVMFLFWELTSVTSFLLISFLHEKVVSRRAALQALLITGGGGLALLAGLVLLALAGNGWQFSALDADAVREHALAPAIVLLVLLGCFTKSAQLPFHLWLPNAMNAPTPVSAFLHSATMVKAGVYLLARLNPTLGNTAGWSEALILFGAATALVGAVLAIRQTDLKRLLAYTTVAVLGQLTMLIGTNTGYALQAFVVLLLAHSFYKGALFMAVGAIDHATGTRQIGRLGGLWRFMPITGFAIGLAAFSNAGLPPFFGFIAKEFKYSGLIELGWVGWMVTLVMVATNALMLAAAGLVFVRTFLGPAGRYPKTPHEVPMSLWLGPVVLALLGFGLGAFNGVSEALLVNPAVQAIAYGPVAVDLYLWGGVTPAVLASVITISLGVFVYLRRFRVRRLLGRLRFFWALSGDRIWDRGLSGVFGVARKVAEQFQHGALRAHLKVLIGSLALFMLLLSAWAVVRGAPLWSPDVWSAVVPLAVIGLLMALAGAASVLWFSGKVAVVSALALSGMGVALFFVAVHAPDVATTQLMVETLSIVFLALVLRGMPDSALGRTGGTRWLRIALAGLAGVSVTLLMLVALGGPLDGDIAQWYLTNSLTAGYGANVVNVILVDFRAFDTLGEILVVAVAALGAAHLLGRTLPDAPALSAAEPVFASTIVGQVLRPLALLMAVLSLIVLWRGHNLPGGGFIGALVAAVAVSLLALGAGVARARDGLPASPAVIACAGLGLATLAGVLALFAGEPFLTGLWLFPGGVPLGTPLLFDIGVFFTVLGSMLHMLFGLLVRGARPSWN